MLEAAGDEPLPKRGMKEAEVEGGGRVGNGEVGRHRLSGEVLKGIGCQPEEGASPSFLLQPSCLPLLIGP